MSADPSTIQTAAGLSTYQGIAAELTVTPEERRILRDCAVRVRELSERPAEAEKKRLWTALNDLRPERPVIFCDPENGWNEIITQDRIKCRNPLLRVWEMHLRKEIFWGTEMGDDKVIENYFNVPYDYIDSGWGLEEKRIGGENGGSYVWEAPISEYEEDFDKLKCPELTIDYERTGQVVALARDILGDILTVRLRGLWWWTLGMTWEMIRLRGLENFMMDMYDKPEWLHRTMAFLRDGTLRKLDFLGENDLFALNTEGTYVGSGGFGWTEELPQKDFNPAHVRTMDMWGFTESQETVGVSADMFEEFVFRYQFPIQERFGINCYGCCEPLDKRWHVVKKVPRLRRVSTSPWANRKDMAAKLEDNYIMSLKPSPTSLAQPKIDEDAIRREVRDDLEVTKDCVVEYIMKDNHTIGHNPENLKTWCRIVREEIERSLA